MMQANELDLAIDVYGQLLREGCTPNLVTYNILIDVHGKTGNWSEAVKVLDALESQASSDRKWIGFHMISQGSLIQVLLML